jgi:hypothetical protein
VELTTSSTGNGEAPAAGADHQQKFRAWLKHQEAPAIEQSQAEINPLIPADLSIPDFLRRLPEIGGMSMTEIPAQQELAAGRSRQFQTG